MPIDHRIVAQFIARGLVLLFLILGSFGAMAQDTSPGEGAEFSFGAAGSGPGQFLELRDITFSPSGVLYALDGAKMNNKTKEVEGNLRVQSFDRSGKLLATIDLRDSATGEKLGKLNEPQRIAVDSAQNVFVTQPLAGKVMQFDSGGKFVRAFDLPGAMAICVWKDPASAQERIAVLAGSKPTPKGKPQVPGVEQIVILTADGKVEKPIALSQPVAAAMDLTADRLGNFYAKGEPNAIYQFSPVGKLLKVLGGNPTSRNEDGSELLHTVAVDSKLNVYAMTWGNPGQVTRFSADGSSLTQRGGQWKWADPWSVHSSYAIFAIDAEDRLWVGVTNRHSPEGVNYKKYHAAPAIVRVKADYFDTPAGAIRTMPTRLPGFKPSIVCGLPFNVSYEAGKAIPMEFVVAAANRSVTTVTVNWNAYDVMKNSVAKGAFELAMENGKEARQKFEFTPSAFGAYFVQATMNSPLGEMGGIGEHVAVTPRFSTLGELKEGESKGGWNDGQRQSWSGLPNLRIHPGKDEKGLAKTDQEIAEAEKYKLTFIVQLVDNMKNLTPEHIRRVVERYKGRVAYYEVCNEPNFTSKVDEYFAGHRMAYKLIKEIDPAAKVMGPATVNMNLEWFKRLYELGLKDVTDAISTHDYEGHESIDPGHWAWKLAEMRKIMSAHGDGTKPIWQTERAIAGVRGHNYQGLVQAIRCTLHRDLLETLGIPADHNYHYYLNQAGYSGVPSYVWSSSGPHPAALALRTRHALTAAVGRTYAGTLDFGTTGNTFLQGVKYAGKDGATIVLRNLGTEAFEATFDLRGASELPVTDAWGNASKVAVREGKVRIAMGQLPTYVELGAGEELIATRVDFGKNIARDAKWEYSGTIEKGDPSVVPPAPANGAAPAVVAPVDPNVPHPLANGILETFHNQNPNGDTNGQKIWTGSLPLDEKGKVVPQALTASFASPRVVDHVIIRTVRADNTFCTALEYELQIPEGEGWKTVASVNHAIPPSEVAKTADANNAIWMDDTNLYVHALSTPVTTSKLRILVKRATNGYVPDTKATAWGKAIAAKLMLREVEIYGGSK